MTYRPPDDKLAVEAFLSFDYHQQRIVEDTFQKAAEAIEDTLKIAVEQARKNVAKASGPSIHDGKGTDGHHTERHGFDWEDTSKLASAIHYRVNWKVTKGGKAMGMPSGQLYVEPIDVRNDYTHTTRKINYGAYLELGYTPVIMRKVGKKVVKVRGAFTRYPFLAPAMYMATGGTKEKPKGGILKKFALLLETHLRDMAANTPGKRKRKRIIEREPITPENMRRKFAGEIHDAVQPIDITMFETSKRIVGELQGMIDQQKADDAREAARRTAAEKEEAERRAAAEKEEAERRAAAEKEEAERRAAAELQKERLGHNIIRLAKDVNRTIAQQELDRAEKDKKTDAETRRRKIEAEVARLAGLTPEQRKAEVEARAARYEEEMAKGKRRASGVAAMTPEQREVVEAEKRRNRARRAAIQEIRAEKEKEEKDEKEKAERASKNDESGEKSP